MADLLTGVFEEDGGEALVQVLADRSDDSWLRYDLKILDVRRQPRLGGRWECGETFSVDQKKGVYFSAMWRLAITPPESLREEVGE